MLSNRRLATQPFGSFAGICANFGNSPMLEFLREQQVCSPLSRMSSTTSPVARKKSLTGIPGFDEILQGGLPSNRLYLLRGEPGVGKTTLALQFLLAGAAA